MRNYMRLIPFSYPLGWIVLSLQIFTACTNKVSKENDVFQQLDLLIHQDVEAISKKQELINSKKQQIHVFLDQNRDSLLSIYLGLANIYDAYIYDSTFHYYLKVIDLSAEMKRDSVYAATKLKLGKLLSTVGLYAEAIDTLRKINFNQLPYTEKVKYYEQLAYTYYDLADFQNENYFAPRNRKIANAYVDSTIQIGEPKSEEVQGVKAFRLLATQRPDSAEYYYKKILDNPNSDKIHKAMAHAVLGFIHLNAGQNESGQEHLIKSAIIEYQLGIKGGISLIVLADHLYKTGQVDIAYQYIKKARNDADLFGSRMRRLHASDVFTKIEQAVLFSEIKKKQILTRYLFVFILFIILLIFLSTIIFRQLFGMKKIHSVIRRNYRDLQTANNQLKESNKIKERYIGYFLRMNSKYIEKLSEIFNALNNMIISKRPERASAIINNINPKDERDSLLKSFDQIFLSIFPDFISDVQKMLRPEEEILIKKGHLLSNDLRIFALIRIGVTDNESIADILNVSVNTVYSYKTKFKNKSDLNSEKFDQGIMRIMAT